MTEQKEQPLVSVVMITYRHEEFIREAVEGVLMQETSFPIELIIADDCSPDNTKSIINNIRNKHPNGGVVHYTRHKENKGIISNFVWGIKRAKGKYVAFCEGDDYWTDPHKLRKQVALLNENEDFAFVHTDYDYLKNKTGRIIPSYYSSIGINNKSGRVFEYTFFNTFIRTLTTCFRKDRLLECEPIFNISIKRKWVGIDLQIYLYLAFKYPIGFINDSTGVYRRLEESASTSHSAQNRIQFQKTHLEVRYYLLELFQQDINHFDSFFYPHLRKFIFLCYYTRDVSLFNYGYLKLKNTSESVKGLDRFYQITISSYLWHIIIFFIRSNSFIKRYFEKWKTRKSKTLNNII